MFGLPISRVIKYKRFNAISLLFGGFFLTRHVFPLIVSCAKYLRTCCSLFLLNIAINLDLIEVTTPRKFKINLLFFLKQHLLSKFCLLIDYTIIDYPGKTLRFEGVALLLSLHNNFRLKIRWFANETLSLATLTSLFKISFWLEREIWDMFGLLFRNHGDLRRILTDYGFLGHPLRKDFPLTGYSEIFYSDISRAIITAIVSLAQEYRHYNYITNWR